MGYYTNFDLTDNSAEVNAKIEEISGYTIYDGEIVEAKWYNHKEDLIKVSLLFPDTTIFCEGIGEDNGDMWKMKVLNGVAKTAKAKLVFGEYE